MRNKQPIKSITPLAKTALTVVLIGLCFALTACDPGHYRFDHEYLADIASVELVYYDNPDQRHFLSWVPDHSDDLKPFDESKLRVLETLDENAIPDLTDTLCECLILRAYYAYDSPNGLCIKLSYSDGNFIIVSSNYESYAGYIGKFYANGAVAEFIGCFCDWIDYKTLVNNYFQTKIR